MSVNDITLQNKRGGNLIATMKIIMKNNSSKKISVRMSSVFHGAMMDLISENTADWLHEGGINPYSQYIYIQEDVIFWNIMTVNREAYEKIIKVLADKELKKIHLTHSDISLEVIRQEIKKVSKSEFMNQYYFKNHDRYFCIRFITPTAFKSKGKYMNYPTVHWILQSLINKHDQTDEKNQIYEPEVLELLEEHVEICRYRLQSTLFHLEGVRIPSFVGEVTMRIKGQQSLANLLCYLLKYGEYTGIGIKSALGMGAAKVECKEKTDER